MAALRRHRRRRKRTDLETGHFTETGHIGLLAADSGQFTEACVIRVHSSDAGRFEEFAAPMRPVPPPGQQWCAVCAWRLVTGRAALLELSVTEVNGTPVCWGHLRDAGSAFV